MGKSLLLASLCLLTAWLFWSCAKEGEEPRYRPTEPTEYKTEKVLDTTLALETRIGPGRPVNDSIRATGVAIALPGPFDWVELLATAQYGPDKPEYQKEVFTVGLTPLGSGPELAAFPVDSTTGLPGIPDPNPPDDGGATLTLLVGTIVVPAGNYEVVVAHGQFFDPAGDWPDINDPLILSVRIVAYRRMPI